MYLSVALEVNRIGITQVKDFFQNIPVSEMASFVKDMASNVWIYVEDAKKEVKDSKTLSMMMSAGAVQLVFRQLVDINNS